MHLDLAAMLSLEYARVRSSPRNSFAKSPPAQETIVLHCAVICWHIQEQTQGGLDPETAKHFDASASPARGITIAVLVSGSRISWTKSSRIWTART
jgi:hypothetical protein